MDLRDPCTDIRDALKHPPVRHYAAITKPAQLTELLSAIDSYQGSFVVCTALKLSPLLMVRPGELRKALWEEFDLDNKLWYIPSARMKRTKDNKINGQPHLVPLSTQAAVILEELYKVKGKYGRLFPSERDPHGYMSDNTLNKALRSMGYSSEIVTTHGFRATARTLAVELLQFPSDVVEAQLAHAVPDVLGRAYNRTEFIQSRIALMQAWANYLYDLRDGKSKVVHAVLPEFKPVTLRKT
jgi:integrase